MSGYQQKQFYPQPLLVTPFRYNRQNSFFLTTNGNIVSVCHRQYSYLHTQFALMYQYMSPKSFNLINVWLYFEVYHRKKFYAHNLGNFVSIYQRQQFYPHTFLVSLCQNITEKMFIHTFLVKLYQEIRDNSFFITYFWLHCVNIWVNTFINTHTWLLCDITLDTTVLSSSTVGYTVSVYETQEFYPSIIPGKFMSVYRHNSFPHKRLVTVYQYVGDNNFNLSHCCLHCDSVWEKKFYPHTLLSDPSHYIRHNTSIPTNCLLEFVSVSDTITLSSHIRLHGVSIADTTVFSSPSVVFTLSIYQT